MKAVFHWLDQNPWFYHWTAPAALGLTLAALCWAAVRRPPGTERGNAAVALSARSWWLWFSCFALTLFAWRWPLTMDPKPLNPDEAMFTAGALTLAHDPVFWRSLDNTTSGQLVSLPPLMLHGLGIPLDYFNARLTGILLMAAALAFSLQTLRRLAGPRSACIGLLPTLLLITFALDWDFVHYSSELLPITLAAAAAWATTRAADRSFRGASWIGAGILLGFMPWAKLQSAPIAAALGLWAVGWMLLQPGRPFRQRLRCLGSFALAALTPTVFMLLGYLATGQFEHAWQSYVLNNLFYAAAWPGDTGLAKIFAMAGFTYGLHAFLAAVALLIAIGLSWSQRLHREPGFWLGLLTASAAAYAIIAPGRGFLHYAQLIVLPLAWLTAACLKAWLDRPTAPPRGFAGMLVLAIIVTLPQLVVRHRQDTAPMEGQLLFAWRFPRHELGLTLRQLRQPGDSLGMWGWDADVFVQAGLPSATRDTQTYRQLEAGPQRDSYYRARYLAELRANKPAFFVDAVGPGAFQFYDRSRDGHESVPELAEFIAAHYVLLGDFHPWRCYLRKDRAIDQQHLRAALAYAARHVAPAQGQDLPEVHTALLPGRPSRVIERREVSMLEPPALTALDLRGDERVLIFDYGQEPKSHERADQSDGILFLVRLEVDGELLTPIWQRLLDPFDHPADRGTQRSEVPLPAFPPGARLIIQTTPGLTGDGAWDWGYAADVRFRRGPLLNFDLLGDTSP